MFSSNIVIGLLSGRVQPLQSACGLHAAGQRGAPGDGPVADFPRHRFLARFWIWDDVPVSVSSDSYISFYLPNSQYHILNYSHPKLCVFHTGVLSVVQGTV